MTHPRCGFFHVEKGAVHKGSASVVNPAFESFDVVLRRDYEEALGAIRKAALAEDLPHEERLLAIERITRG